MGPTTREDLPQYEVAATIAVGAHIAIEKQGRRPTE